MSAQKGMHCGNGPFVVHFGWQTDSCTGGDHRGGEAGFGGGEGVRKATCQGENEPTQLLASAKKQYQLPLPVLLSQSSSLLLVSLSLLLFFLLLFSPPWHHVHQAVLLGNRIDRVNSNAG